MSKKTVAIAVSIIIIILALLFVGLMSSHVDDGTYSTTPNDAEYSGYEERTHTESQGATEPERDDATEMYPECERYRPGQLLWRLCIKRNYDQEETVKAIELWQEGKI